MTDILRIYTFGGLTILQSDTPIVGFVSRKVSALLVYLACNPREHPRELLAELLWDDLSQARAMGNLRTALSNLQEQLAPYLLVTRQTISINPEASIWVDARAMESELDNIEQQSAIMGSMSRTAASKLEQTLTLFKGDFLAGFNVRDSRGFEGWQVLEGERLRGRVIEAQHRLVDHHLNTHQYSAGIAQANQLLQLDPLWEDTHRQLMLLYARSGQRRAALSQYETCVHILDEELGVEPDKKTRAVYERIQAGEVVVTTEIRLPTHNLPADTKPFIDRPRDIERVLNAIGDPACRLLTIVGPGGSGKTRLSLHVAATEMPKYADGVFQVLLAPIQSAELIVSAILDTLKINAGDQADSKVQLFKYLSKRQLLLVLDNFEHLLEGVDIILDILAHAADVKILVTSRERLNVWEEWVISINGMDFPTIGTEDQELAQYSAIELFYQSARRTNPDFVLRENSQAVIRICQLVQGMPLGLELASTWLRVMPCNQIADEIANSLDILQTTLRNVPERHRSIRATFESSWRLLTDNERDLLQRLSVFHGSFHQQSAQQITGASALTLLALRDKSLLNADEGYYEVHELVRQFAAEKLGAYPEEEKKMRAAHSTYYASFLERNQPRISSNASLQALYEIGREIENIYAAWDYAFSKVNLDLLGKFFEPLFTYFNVRSRSHEGEQLFGRAVRRLAELKVAPDNLTYMRAMLAQGAMFVAIGQYREAQTAIEVSLPVIQRHNLAWETRLGLAAMGSLLYARGEYREAWNHYEQALAYYSEAAGGVESINLMVRLSDIATVLGEYERARQLLTNMADRRSKALFLTTLGDLEYKVGNYSAAKQRFKESLETSDANSDETSRGVALVSLGRAAYALGNYHESIQLCIKSIAICNEIHNQWGKSFALAHLGRANHALGHYHDAVEHYDEALAICREMGNQWVMSFTFRQLSATMMELGNLDEAAGNAFTAFDLATIIEANPLRLDAIVGIANVLRDQNRREEAIELAQLARQNPISEYSTRKEAEDLLLKLNVPSKSEGAKIDKPNDKSAGLALETLTEFITRIR